MIRSYLYNLLLKNYPLRQKKKLGQWLWSKVTQPGTSVITKLHGFSVRMPSDYVYPLICRNFKTFNNPYLELVHQTWLERKKGLNIIDAGAAIGDTFLFIIQNDPEVVNKIFCIEGNTVFLKYLKKNTSLFDTAVIIERLLSDEEGLIPELVSLHNSTAGAIGNKSVLAQKLDSVLENQQSPVIDILKTDVEGFDGKVLAGSANLLRKQLPNVIFEFHPLLINKTGNDILQPFHVLKEYGYKTLIWYNKFGVFNHNLSVDNETKIKYLADRCLKSEDGEDWHYDIIALPAGHSLNISALQNCTFASTKSFPF